MQGFEFDAETPWTSISSKPRNRANLSPVWRHFTRIGDARSCLGSCLHCGTEVAVPGGSTTGMFSHLSVHHPRQYKDAKEHQQLSKSKFFASMITGAPDCSPDRCFPDIYQHLERPAIEPFLLHGPQIIAVKSLEPRHTQKSVFPYMYHMYKIMKDVEKPKHDESLFDLVLHCDGGQVLGNKLPLAAVSHYVRKLLEENDQPVDHVLLPDIKVEIMEHFIQSIYRGTLDFKDETLHELFDLFGVPHNVKETRAHEEQDNLDIAEESNDSYIEPVLHLDIGTKRCDLDMNAPDGCFSADYDNLASESEIEAKALELKDKIFAECGIVSKKRKLMRNTRNPSKIWKWFTKTPNFIYCKICGVGIKNSGNTTNASSHLKRHPEQYSDFKLETVSQSMETIQEAENGLMSKSAEEEYDQLVWKYFQTSRKFNRKAKCYLCGKETPSGSGNVLLHLRHHHPEEHTKVVDQVARGQLQRAAGQSLEQDADSGGIGWKPSSSAVSDPEASSASSESSPMVSIKKETLQIKMEINTEEDDESY